VEIEIRSGQSVIGGGSTPAQHLATCLITVASARYSAAQVEARLRQPASSGTTGAADRAPVLARVEDQRLVLDLRTVFPEQEVALAAALASALR
jgi:L-seryl-tRNA(Ser) seleniumtransferase